MGLVDRIWRELETPDSVAVPSRAYLRAVIGLGHAMVGAAAVASLGLGWGLGVAVPLAVGYWLVKERGDLRRGGAFWDGAEDTVMVALGAWYGAAWWPVLMLACAGYIMAAAWWRAAP